MVAGGQKLERPIVGITLGDAAGIGPEIILKALADEELLREVRPVIVGDRGILTRTAAAMDLNADLVDLGDEASDSIEIVDLANLPSDLEIGKVSMASGMAAGQFIEKAVDLWREGKIDAICTAPLNKLSLSLGGYDFPGHTEFIAKLTDTKEFAMSFFADDLRVVLLSTHLPLAEAIKKVTVESMSKLIRFTDHTLSGLLSRQVKLAVAGVNPHASENGMFGSEEAEQIEPAIEMCRGEGVDVSGPYSPDTIFLRAFRGEFDGVIACYHDQATIAVKCLSFGAGVNVTLGLPLIRTSVDHGTAFDIAGKGVADASSMKVAIRLAAKLVSLKR